MLSARNHVRPTSKHERALLQDYGAVVGMDEVGRGSLAGPVAVGAVLIDRSVGRAPAGLADSKLLTAPRREQLVAPIRRWARASAVGWATPSEISTLGLTEALRLAGMRALNLATAGLALVGSTDLGGPTDLAGRADSAHPADRDTAMSGGSSLCVLLDGSHDWLSCPPPSLFDEGEISSPQNFDVVTKVKADLTSRLVAAASILAKVARDHYMSSLPDPGYDWARNKGYASARHTTALRELGPCGHHRLGWRLPGVAS